MPPAAPSPIVRIAFDLMYRVAARSAAYAEFNQWLYGRDLQQASYTNLPQLDRLIQDAAIGADSSALELGCGLGGAAEYIFEQTGASVTGIDLSAQAVRLASERAGERSGGRLRFVVGDLNTLMLESNWYDACYSLDVLQFVNEVERLVATLHRTLKPGGRFFAYTLVGLFGPHTPLDLAPETNRYAHALRQAGFGAVRAVDVTAGFKEHVGQRIRLIRELLGRRRGVRERLLMRATLWGDDYIAKRLAAGTLARLYLGARK